MGAWLATITSAGVLCMFVSDLWTLFRRRKSASVPSRDSD
jgi:hypothetical protein